MADNPSHLVERIAERLRGVGGLSAVEPAPERDIRNVVRREAEHRPAPRRPVAPPPPPEPAAPEAADGANAGHLQGGHPQGGYTQGGFGAGGYDGHDDEVPPPADGHEDDPERSTALAVNRSAVERAERPTGRDGSRAVIDPSLRAPPVLSDPSASLSMPDVTHTPPLDMAALERAGMVVGHKVRTRISEEFRITVGHILRSMHANYSPGRGAPNVLMVTSARPGEGKSFSSLNLAGSIAQHTQREVLLVDVDAKQRSISAELGLADRPGLLDLSTNSSLRIEDVIVRTAIPHLSIVTIGSGHTIGTEISPTRPVTALVERIARRFPNAVVLLDAPPCLSTSDPSTLAPFVGQIVLVVEAERTQRNEVVAALDLIKACPSITLMLNKIRLTTSYTFGAYHYFGTYS
jgi:receptor protein-tyrosine kinase